MRETKKYIIYTPGYDENAGGRIVLHYLCHLINHLGGEAYLWNEKVSRKGKPTDNQILLPLRTCIRLKKRNRDYATNPQWTTPLFKDWASLLTYKGQLDDYIVVYPEIIDGNPLRAKNVVRLLMHNPGHFTGQVNYGQHEYLIRYSPAFAKNFVPDATSVMSEHFLTISTTPSAYHREGEALQRKGTAYLIRKGKDKPLVHDLTDSVCIDGMSHAETADVLRRVRCLYCYDPVTAYMRFAWMCGCRVISVLSPEENPETYNDGFGRNRFIEYSLDGTSVDVDAAYNYAMELSRQQGERSEANAKDFLQETQAFFSSKG